MPYSINLPDGSTVDNIPDELDPKEAARRIAASHPELMGMLKPDSRKSGFIPAAKAGWENLKGDIAGLAGRSGLMSIKDAEAQQARNKAEAERVFTPTKEGWLDSPWLKFKETLGGSAPYMAAPLAAGAGAAVAAPTLPAVAMGAAGLTSAAQFTGSNLSRQQQEGKALADTDLQSAALVAVPQAALDMVGFKMIPGIRRIFAAAGKELTPQAAAAIAKSGLKSTLADYAKAGIKASGAEGLTEAGQQVLERLQAGLELNDVAAREEYLQSFIGGAALGGALAGPGRFQERGREQLQAAKREEAKQVQAEQAAAAANAAAEQQKEVQRKDPAYAQKVAADYRAAEAEYRKLLPPKLAKGADEATKVEHKAQSKIAKDFLDAKLKPQIDEYLKVKPVLQAQQAQQQAATPKPGTPEEEAGLLFPLAQTDLQPPGPAIPTADEVAQQRQQLADQAQALDVHVESLRDQAAKAETPEDSLRINKLFTQAQAARAQAQQQIDELPKAPKNVDLAKQLENANKAWLKAKEEGDPEAAARAALRIQKAKAAGADLMQPSTQVRMPEVQTGGKSEAAGDFTTRVAAQQRAGDAAQARLGAVESEEGQDTQPLFDHPADVEARRKAAEAAAAAEKQRKTDAEVTAMGARPLDTSRTVQTSLLDDTEAPVRIQQGKSDMGNKTRAELVADLQIANITQNDDAIELAKEGLRDLKARAAAEKAGTIGGDTTSADTIAARQTAEALAGTRMPGNVAKQQAARDAMHRAYGNMVMILNRFNKGRAKQEELDQARAQVLENLAEDIATSRGAPLTKPELLTLQQDAGQLLNDLQTRFGDTRDVINFGTKKDPDMGPVQERDGTFIRDKFERQLGVKNEQSRRPGRQTFRNPHAAAMTIKEGLEKLRADAVNNRQGPAPTPVTATKKTTSPEDLEAALARAKSSPLVERLRDNLPAFAADPDRRNLAAEWLYKESIGQKNDVGAEVASELDRLEAGKRSDEVVQDDLAPDAELQGTVFATKEAFDEYLAGDAVAEMRDAYQRIENAMMSLRVADVMPALDAKIRNAEKNVAAAEQSNAVDAADKVKEAALALQTLQDEKVRLIELTNKAPAPTMSRVAASTRATQVELEKLQTTLTRLQAQHTEARKQQGEDARKTEARLQKATAKLQELIRDRTVVKMEPLRAREANDLAELQKAYAEIAAIEAKIRDNLVHFAGKFPDGDSVEVLADEWHALGVDYRLALDEEMANGTDMDFFSAGPVIEAHAARDEALVKLMSALVNDLQYTPDTRTILAFLNKGAQLEMDLRDAVTRMNEAAKQVKVTQDNMRMLPATAANAARKTKEGKALQAEMADAKTQAEEIAARDKTLGEIAKTIRSISDAVAKATQEIDAAKADTLSAQQARTTTGVMPDATQEQAAAERREENDRLERMAAMPGENVKFTDMQAVADAFIALPKEVDRLAAKAADTALSKTTRAQARHQLKNVKWKLKNLTGLLSEDATVVAAARDAAKVQIDWLNDKIGAKRIAINEDGITDSVRNSRKEELKKLRQEMQSLQRFIAEFDTKVTRTPVETAEERKARLSTPPPDIRGVKGTSAKATARMAELQAIIEDGTKTDEERAAARETQQRMMGTLSPETEAEIERMQAIVDNADAPAGARRIAQNNLQLLREGRLKVQKKGPLVKKKVTPPQARNPIIQSGQATPVSGTQAVQAAVKDTAFENAMLKLSDIEALQEKNDTALEKATAAGDTAKVEKFTAFAERLAAAQAQAQANIDGIVAGRRKKKATASVAVPAAKPAADSTRGMTELQTTLADNDRSMTELRATLDDTDRRIAKLNVQLDEMLAANAAYDAQLKASALKSPITVPQFRNPNETSLTDTQVASLIGNDITAAMADIANESKNNAAVRAVAQRLATLLEGTTSLVVTDHRGIDGTRALGSATSKQVVLDNSTSGLTQETLLHEGTHAATMRVLAMPEEQLSQTQRVAKKELQALHASAQRDAAIAATMHDKTDLVEFAAEVMSNTKLQAQLQSKPWKLSDAWTGFKSIVLRLLGVKNPDNMLHSAMKSVDALMVAPKTQPKVTNETPQNRAASTGSRYASDDIFAKKKTMKERLEGNAALAFEQGAVDMRASLAKTLKTGSSKLAAQAMYYVRKNDHMMSNTYAVMQHGALGIKVDARGNRIIEAGHSKSVQDVFKAIGKIPGANDADRMQKAQIYLTANRVANDPMAAQALDLNGAAVAKLQADLAKFQADTATMKALENVRDVYADLNRGMLQFLVDTGAMKKAEAARLTASNSYVPFYRVRGDGVAELVFDENRTIRLGDIRTQPYLKELKGGTAKLLPLNEAVTRNVMLLTSMGMRNQTTRNVAYALQEIGRAASTKHKPMQIVPGDGGADAGVMRFKQDGDEYHIKVDTTGTAAEGIPADLLARSIEGTHLVVPSIVKGFSWFSDVLRSGVTRNPMYVARQLFRDPFAASFTGGLDRGPLTAVAKSIAAYVHQTASGPSKTAQDLIRKGLVQSQIFSGGPEDLAKISLQLAGGDQGAFDKLFSAMDRAAMRADAVTREQVYDDVLARTGSEMEAEVAASEMMDFQKRGSSATVQYAARMIPFFNAQIQGLNVLVKAARGTASMQERLDIQNKFFERAMLLAAGTLVYAAAMEDDDAYKNARPSDRYGYWFVPIPGMKEPLKLPIPFEVGVLFKVLPEAIMDMMNGKFDAQEMKAIRGLMLNQIPGFSSAGQAQAIKPIIEVATNHSFFTGREIEGAGMQRLDPQERYTARTTELVKRMSEAMPDAVQLSPVQIEHLTRGFFGSLPLMGAALVNEVFAKDTAVDRPTTKLSETPLFGGLFQDVNGGGPTDALYAKIRAADMAKATIDKMKAEGRKQDALIYMRDVENLAHIPKLHEADKELQLLAQQEKRVRASDNTPERKRELLDAVNVRREKMSQRYLDAVSAVAR